MKKILSIILVVLFLLSNLGILTACTDKKTEEAMWKFKFCVDGLPYSYSSNNADYDFKQITNQLGISNSDWNWANYTNEYYTLNSKVLEAYAKEYPDRNMTIDFLKVCCSVGDHITPDARELLISTLKSYEYVIKMDVELVENSDGYYTNNKIELYEENNGQYKTYNKCKYYGDIAIETEDGYYYDDGFIGWKDGVFYDKPSKYVHYNRYLVYYKGELVILTGKNDGTTESQVYNMIEEWKYIVGTPYDTYFIAQNDGGNFYILGSCGGSFFE